MIRIYPPGGAMRLGGGNGSGLQLIPATVPAIASAGGVIGDFSYWRSNTPLIGLPAEIIFYAIG